MAKKLKDEQAVDPNNETAPKKRGRAGKNSGALALIARLVPFLPKLGAWAEDDYKKTRFDQDATDEQVRSADELRKVLADFGSAVKP